jgi:TonB family protein
MTLLASLLAWPVTHALAWTLVHFFWQGALLAIVAAALMRWGAPDARARYGAGVVMLALMLAAPVVTFLVVHDNTASAPAITHVDVTAAASEPAPAGARISNGAATPAIPPVVLSTLVLLWLTGVLVLSLRLLGGWVLARRLATAAVQPVRQHVQAMADTVRARLGLTRLVRVAESSTVTVPLVVGWLKPVVLLPAAALTGLTPGQVEALLAHEMAHVRRHDYLVNLLQSVVETLLFYHPGVWWLSGRIRVEREHCCDDLVVTICDRVVYVDALTDLAAMTLHARLALAATDGPLLCRVRRLLTADAGDRAGAGWISIGIALLLVASLTPAVTTLARIEEPASQAPAAAPVALSGAPSVATPSLTAPPVRGSAIVPAPAARQAARDIVPDSPTQNAGTTAAATTPATQQRVYIIGGNIREPTLQKRVEPVYPAEAKAAGQQGPVYVEAIIGRDGRVRDAKPVSGIPHRLLREAAVAAVQQWVYSPTLLNGEAIEVQLSVQVNFRLQESPLITTRRLLDEASAQYSPEHPDVRRLEARVRTLQAEAASGVPAEARTAGPTLVRDPLVTVRPGDILDIVVAGESALPRRYLVESTDGTIKFPLIGAIRVVDLTTAEVRQVLEKTLADRKLAEARRVTVVIYRLD